MNVTEASQIVLSPNDVVDEAMQFRLEELSLNLNRSRMVRAKLWFGMAIHWVGIHTYVRHKQYDEVSDSLVDVGWVCMFCARGKR